MKIKCDNPITDNIPWYIECDCGNRQYYIRVEPLPHEKFDGICCNSCYAEIPFELRRKKDFLKKMYIRMNRKIDADED